VIIPMPFTSLVVADTDWASFVKGQTPHGVRYVVDRGGNVSVPLSLLRFPPHCGSAKASSRDWSL
jgi:hypothetical protein